MKIKLFSILFFCITYQGYAQGNYSLVQCIEYSLQNHSSTEVYQNNIIIAKERKKQAISYYLPQINVNSTVTDNLKLQTNIIPAGVLSDEDISMQFGKKYNSNIYGEITQTIYNQPAIYNIKSSQVNIKIADLQQIQNSESIIFNTAQAYFQVLVYKEYKAKLQEIIQSYIQLLDILKLKHQKGIIIETDVERVSVSLKSAEYQLNEVETQIKNALDNLKFTMGLSLESELHISDSTNYEQYVSFPEIASLNINNLTEYEINKTQQKLLEYNYKSQKAELLPTINLFSRAGKQGYSEDMSGIFNSWKDYSYIGVSVSMNLFSGLRKSSKIKESKLVLKNSYTNLHLAETGYQLTFQNSEKNLLNAYNNLNGSKDNLALAKKILDTSSLNYQKGASPISVFLNDDNAYKNAQLQYVNNLFSYMSRRLDYEKNKGTLFSFYNQLKNN